MGIVIFVQLLCQFYPPSLKVLGVYECIRMTTHHVDIGRQGGKKWQCRSAIVHTRGVLLWSSFFVTLSFGEWLWWRNQSFRCYKWLLRCYKWLYFRWNLCFFWPGRLGALQYQSQNLWWLQAGHDNLTKGNWMGWKYQALPSWFWGVSQGGLQLCYQICGILQ